MEHAINQLFDAIGRDFSDWNARGGRTDKDFHGEMVDMLTVEEGSKYLKIVKTDSQVSVWGFIVKQDGPKFKAGDILKAASWKKPARNKARGNILDGGYSIRWTGPEYL